MEDEGKNSSRNSSELGEVGENLRVEVSTSSTVEQPLTKVLKN